MTKSPARSTETPNKLPKGNTQDTASHPVGADPGNRRLSGNIRTQNPQRKEEKIWISLLGDGGAQSYVVGAGNRPDGYLLNRSC